MKRKGGGSSRREIKYYGYRACERIFQERPEEIIRVYLEQALVRECAPLLKWCASQKKSYGIIPPEELEKVTESVHHEGICIVALEPERLSLEELLKRCPPKSCLLYLDGVENPHNVGSIARTCAHFGVMAILGEADRLPKVSPSMCRIATGGMEHVSLVAVDQAQRAFKKLADAGFTIVATSSHGGSSLYEYRFPERSLIVMGSESYGVSNALTAVSADTLMIPGTGQVESLNVSVATSLCLGEYYRQHNA